MNFIITLVICAVVWVTGCSNLPTYIEAPVMITHASEYPFSNKVAVIIEPRKHPLLVPIIKNFMSVLGPEWKIQIFHGIANGDFLYQSELGEHIRAGRIYLSELNRSNLSVPMYNQLMLNPYLWEQVKGEEVLIFQTDTVLCSTSPVKIEQFSEYDYVGSPWINENSRCFIYQDPANPSYQYVSSNEDTSQAYLEQFKKAKNVRSVRPNVGNGGLSYRKRSKTLAILKRYIPVDTKHVLKAEDIFYSCVAADPESDFKAPPVEIARHFSTEQTFQTEPFGVHKPWVHLSSKEMSLLEQSCPELENILKKHYIW